MEMLPLLWSLLLTVARWATHACVKGDCCIGKELPSGRVNPLAYQRMWNKMVVSFCLVSFRPPVTDLTSLWARLRRWPRPTPARAWMWAGSRRWASSAGGHLRWEEPPGALRRSAGPGKDWTRWVSFQPLQLLWGHKLKQCVWYQRNDTSPQDDAMNRRCLFTCSSAGNATACSSGRWSAQRLDVMDQKLGGRKSRVRLDFQELHKHLREGL